MFGLFGEKQEKRTNVVIFDEEMAELDKMLNDTLKASGVSVMDVVDGLDEESGATLGRVCQSYKKIVKLAREQAGIIDQMNDKLDALTELNTKMSKQLEDLTNSIKKSKEK